MEHNGATLGGDGLNCFFASFRMHKFSFVFLFPRVCISIPQWDFLMKYHQSMKVGPWDAAGQTESAG